MARTNRRHERQAALTDPPECEEPTVCCQQVIPSPPPLPILLAYLHGVAACQVEVGHRCALPRSEGLPVCDCLVDGARRLHDDALLELGVLRAAADLDLRGEEALQLLERGVGDVLVTAGRKEGGKIGAR